MLCEGQPLAAKLLKFLLDNLPVDMSTCSGSTRFMYFIRYFEMLRRHAAGIGEEGNFRKLIQEVSWSEAVIKMLADPKLGIFRNHIFLASQGRPFPVAPRPSRKSKLTNP